MSTSKFIVNLNRQVTPGNGDLIKVIRDLRQVFGIGLLTAKQLGDQLITHGQLKFDHDDIKVKYASNYLSELITCVWVYIPTYETPNEKLLEAALAGDTTAALEFCKYVNTHGWVAHRPLK